MGDWAGGGKVELSLSNDNSSGSFPTGSVKLEAGQDLDQQLGPPGSGGLLVALHLWRQMLVEGPEKFGNVVYYGTAPLENLPEQAEIMQASLPSFIIRPFVEKALEQVTATENKGFLHLQFTRRGNQLVVKLQHSGNTSPLVDDLLQTRLNVLKRQGKTVEINTLPLKNLQGHSTGIQQEIILPLDWQV